MEASILDLRYKMKDVLKALERRENVRILYHGKEKGTIIPADPKAGKSVKDHPFFGMRKKDRRPVPDVMDDLRGERYRAL
jgi:hypothetical protein